jgi:hypothetical protein
MRLKMRWLGSEHLIYRRCGLRMQGWHEVRIRVEGQRNRCVAEHLADHFRVHPLRQKQGRGRMPKIVKAHDRETKPTQL